MTIELTRTTWGSATVERMDARLKLAERTMQVALHTVSERLGKVEEWLRAHR